jgi:DNA replication and repair protein RecF
MQLTALRAERFRNLKEVDLRFPAGLTVIGGNNGQGKTSLLEAAYLLGTGLSFRTRKMDELVSWDGGPMSTVGRVSNARGEVELAVALEGKERKLLVHGVPRGQEDFLGRLDVVDLTARRMDVLRGAPEERRRFLDRGVVGIDPSYLRVLGEYRRVLQQRNALLRNARHASGVDAQLDAWDERLVETALPLHLARRRYADRLGEQLGRIGPELLPDGMEPRLVYKPSPRELGENEEEALPALLAERVHRCRGRDRELGHTSEGPHRDELAVELNGVDLRRFGSAGQVRAAMISLKLGKLSLLGSERGEAPLFLMDDFDTDLDDTRMEALAGYLSRAGSQAVVATSKEDWIGRLEAAEMELRIESGVARVV